MRTTTAARDVGAAVEFIRKRRVVDKINLLGWSWGTRIMPAYTVGNNNRVNKLILYAPGWPLLVNAPVRLGCAKPASYCC